MGTQPYSDTGAGRRKALPPFRHFQPEEQLMRADHRSMTIHSGHISSGWLGACLICAEEHRPPGSHAAVMHGEL